MSEMVEVLIGGAESDHVRIRVVGREIPSATDYWDGNWLVTPIELRVGDSAERCRPTSERRSCGASARSWKACTSASTARRFWRRSTGGSL